MRDRKREIYMRDFVLEAKTNGKNETLPEVKEKKALSTPICLIPSPPFSLFFWSFFSCFFLYGRNYFQSTPDRLASCRRKRAKNVRQVKRNAKRRIKDGKLKLPRKKERKWCHFVLQDGEVQSREGCMFGTGGLKTRRGGGEGGVFETTCFLRHDSDKMTSLETGLCDVLWLPASLSFVGENAAHIAALCE